MMVTFPSEACAFTCTWKDVFIAEAAIQKQHVNKRYFPGHYSHFSSFAGYLEKQSHNRMTDSHWALSIFP